VVRTSLADPHPHNNCHFGTTGVGRKEVEEEGRKKKKKNWVWARREYTVLGAVLRCLGCQPFFRPPKHVWGGLDTSIWSLRFEGSARDALNRVSLNHLYGCVKKSLLVLLCYTSATKHKFKYYG
jgi:hypothetical protein